ncbi:EAL and HDOD domain-containing protein [Rhodocyclus tenuis]|uniref:EAL and modified HD-GYP domain-containing signal transduction protein n=1 Tax=Rhodocyclus tenuis TaxID=1066 RepID=A0A840GAS5_RHOTE|nr:EAL domain-containing protein [Rhodocyclus tenuis]MBB4247768.1 EAL and modified HD-GYP domain-containing signal transduction protein [Rhodocyclus tenuis]
MSEAANPPDADNTELFLGRQPILGRDQQLSAYELLFRSGGLAGGAEVADATQATATVIANAFTEFGVGDALGPYRGYINVDHDFLFSDVIEMLPQQAVVLEILETVEPSEAVLARCQHLRALGFTLAVDDVIRADASYRPLLELAEIIKVDVMQLSPAELRALVLQLKPLGKKLLAEKVETAQQMEFCRSLGFELFQGYFFAKPTIIAGKRLSPSHVTLLRLLALLMEDADTSEIERAFKLEPGLTVNLLRLTNSVGSGMSVRIASLRHAIAVLGRRQLQRWLQLLLYTNPKGGEHAVSPLMQLAATRGRLMELLAEKSSPGKRELADQAFLVGIMSLMPTLLSVAMTEILEQLPVPLAVAQALSAGDGALGTMLELTEAIEGGEVAAVETALRRLPGLRPRDVNLALAQALAWANSLGVDSTIQ